MPELIEIFGEDFEEILDKLGQAEQQAQMMEQQEAQGQGQ